MHQENRRDVALTTLIDLLVQVVFVFTLVLIASGSLDGSPEDRGYVTPEVWKTLVSAFGLNATDSHIKNVQDIVDQHNKVKEERGKAPKQRDELRIMVDELDKKIAVLEKKAGAPGQPPCRNDQKEEIFVGVAKIDAAGLITFAATDSARRIAAAALEVNVDARKMSRIEFIQRFKGWRDFGAGQAIPCKYTVSVEYDPRAIAGEYQPSISSIYSAFRIQSTILQGGR